MNPSDKCILQQRSEVIIYALMDEWGGKGRESVIGWYNKNAEWMKEMRTNVIQKGLKIIACFPVYVSVGIIYITLKIENTHKKFLAGNSSAWAITAFLALWNYFVLSIGYFTNCTIYLIEYH